MHLFSEYGEIVHILLLSKSNKSYVGHIFHHVEPDEYEQVQEGAHPLNHHDPFCYVLVFAHHHGKYSHS